MCCFWNRNESYFPLGYRSPDCRVRLYLFPGYGISEKNVLLLGAPNSIYFSSGFSGLGLSIRNFSDAHTIVFGFREKCRIRKQWRDMLLILKSSGRGFGGSSRYMPQDAPGILSVLWGFRTRSLDCGSVRMTWWGSNHGST